MTTLGLSIAREQDYDIVTPSTEFHETLLATKLDAVFDALVSADDAEPSATTSQTRCDLGQLVITMTGINYQALRPEDIPELQASRHFGKFQQLIRSRAQSIDREEDPRAYKEQLKSEGAQIIEEWHNTRNDVSSGLRDTLFEQALTLGGEALKAYVKGPEVTDLLTLGGVAIGLLIRRGLTLREKQRDRSPFQYLTEIVQAENSLLRMTFPLGLES